MLSRFSWLAMRAGSLLVLMTASATAATVYQQTNLVSDIPGMAAHTDPNLVNPWGISSSATSPIWVSDAGTSKATVYNGSGTPQALVVSIPPSGTEPTGQVFNDSGSGFNVNGQSSRFLFATTSGTVAGWNSASGTTAIIGFNSTDNAVYTGLAMGTNAGQTFLYAADFAGGKIDVIDTNFGLTTVAGAFNDPNLPAGYSPFNIQNINGHLFVLYALVDQATHEETKGAGLGIVAEFNPDGTLVRRFATGGALNAPWAMVQAPAGFGEFSGALLIGNFGDGRINAFDPATGNALGVLTALGGIPIENEGLWGLRFGNGGNGGDPTTLFFAAGIDDENHGLFGSIQPTPEPGTLALLSVGVLAGMWRLRRRTI